MSFPSDHREVPSFYRLLEGAKPITLGFWFDNQTFEGPVDPATAKLTPERYDWCEDEVKVVDLGEGRFRLADKPDFGELTEINWGDEFYADSSSNGLEFVRRVLPAKFRHEQWVMTGPISNETDLSNTIHALGGGWFCIMGGICTVTLPVEAWEVFKQTKIKQSGADKCLFMRSDYGECKVGRTRLR